MDHGTGSNGRHMSMSSEVDDLCESFKGELTLNGSLNFDQDGEMRYFGPTSGRLQFSDYCSSEQVTGPGIHSSDPEPVLNGINIDEYLDPTILDSVIDEFGIPKPLENRSVDLYFTWEQPWYPVVDEVLSGRVSAAGDDIGAHFSTTPYWRWDPGSAGNVWMFEQIQMTLTQLGNRFWNRQGSCYTRRWNIQV